VSYDWAKHSAECADAHLGQTLVRLARLAESVHRYERTQAGALALAMLEADAPAPADRPAIEWDLRRQAAEALLLTDEAQRPGVSEARPPHDRPVSVRMEANR
jgi:hypothetical protein